MKEIEKHKHIIKKYHFDSRKIEENDLFFALKGDKADGHDFIELAAKNKAFAAVVSKEYKGSDFGIKLFYADDVLACIHKLAHNKAKERKFKIIAITGSVGKTTTKDFLFTLLEEKYKVVKSFASYNSKITMPISLLNADDNCDFLILEMAMSKKGQIKKLVEIANPDICIVTKIALSHSENFPDGIKGIAKEKLDLLTSKNVKFAIVHQSANDFIGDITLPVVSYAYNDLYSDYTITSNANNAEIINNDESVPMTLPFYEMHLQENFLAAVICAKYLDITEKEIIKRASMLKASNMRFEKFVKNEILFINDAYNANPESMKMAFLNLPKPIKNAKKIAVLGDMKELGIFSETSHKEITEYALNTFDFLLCMGSEMKKTIISLNDNEKVYYFASHVELANFLKTIISSGDVVLVKGSRSMNMENIFNYLN